MTLARALYATAAAFALAGVVLQVAPARVPTAHPTAPLPATTHASSSTARPAQDYGAVVRVNLFSAERTPPRQRFVPAGMVSREAPHQRAAPSIRLYGITVGEQGAMALIDADPVIPGAEIYHVGDVVAGAPITAITDSTVILSQPSGPRVLRLQRSSRKQP